MRTWEKINQIIAFYQSYPSDEDLIVSFMVTIRTANLSIYHNFKHYRQNPQVKDYPEEIIDDARAILGEINPKTINLTVYSTLSEKKEDEKFEFYSQFLYPVIQNFKTMWSINKIKEYNIDLFSLRGLYETNRKNFVSEAINTVVYV